ncbi:MAG: riboflavin biosynthesis protein RibD [marine bacterium B5-7]|nr:MAG: riboflavin biosynthesis protein RibD [marine bacterium B5-7]
MRRAIELASNSLFISDPNPRVGCVIVKDGQIISEGWTQLAGGNHAEIHALRDLGERARDADVYVSLEPCSHTGQTGPCTEALIDAGVRRVFMAILDPNPKVCGNGVERLINAGIEVHVGLGMEQAHALNRGFIRRMTGGFPWVRMKLGASLDGRTALKNGQSKWITSQESRDDVQKWRARSSAVVTGIDTVIADNPSLNVRIDNVPRQPLRVVVDSTGRIDPQAKIFSVAGRAIVATCRDSIDGVKEVLTLPAYDDRVDLTALMSALAKLNCNEILIESGARLSGAFIAQGLVDELVIYYSPKLLGDNARGMFEIGNLTSLTDAPRLRVLEMNSIGEDIRIVAAFLRPKS